MLSIPEQRVEPDKRVELDGTHSLSECANPDAIGRTVDLENHALGRRLLDEGHGFDYAQALYILEQLLPAIPGSSAPSADAIAAFTDCVHIRASAALAFPPADIRSIRLAQRPSPPTITADQGPPLQRSVPPRAEPDVVVTAMFMGLYGIDSPLPVSFREDVSRSTDGSLALRAFLDIFDRRFYAFFYRAWRKHRPALRIPETFASPGETVDRVRPFLALARCNTGPADSEAPVPPLRLASFASTLTRRTRSARGLKTLVSGLLDGLPVLVKENVSRRIPISTPSGLGLQGARLGVDSHLGRQIQDRSSTFRLSIGPVDIDTYRSLLPGEPLARRLAWLVDLYVSGILAYDVELILRTEAVDDLCLGGRAKLGQSTFLGDVAATVTRIVSYVDR